MFKVSKVEGRVGTYTSFIKVIYNNGKKKTHSQQSFYQKVPSLSSHGESYEQRHSCNESYEHCHSCKLSNSSIGKLLASCPPVFQRKLAYFDK